MTAPDQRVTSRRRRLALLAVLALGAGACAGDEQLPPGTGQVQGQQSSYGLDDPEAGPACFLATDDAAVRQLWRLAVAGSVVGDGPVPPAEFRAPAVGVFLGARPSGGYAVAVRAASTPDDDGTVTLEVETVEPGPGDVTVTVITSPYVLYVLPEGTTTVELAGDIEVDCQARVPELPSGDDPAEDEDEDR